MPKTAREAERVYRHWDRLNGRYYFMDDLFLDNQELYRDVVFDGIRILR